MIIRLFEVEAYLNTCGITAVSNQSSKQIHVARAKRGKTCADKSRFVLVLPLIG